MRPVAPHIVDDVSFVTRINHDSHFLWQAQHLVTLDGESCCWRIVNYVSFVTRINHETIFRGRRNIW